MKKKIKIIIIFVFLLLLISAVGFYIWTQFYYEATEDALVYVSKQDRSNLIFGDKKATTGFIFYQGGKVDAVAYSYLGVELAKEGYFVVIPQLPFNLAIFGINEAKNIMERFDDVDRWYVGGHSLGGSMFSRFAFQNNKLVEGIILLASYPADDFSNSPLPILSIYGEVDGLVTLETMAKKQGLLSSQATLAMIKGGNYANFGMYGPQRGDNGSLISDKQQRDETLSIIINWLD